MKEKLYNMVTISRQMGSGGTYIGYLAAKELKFRYFDREILRLAASKLGIEPDTLEKYDERSVSLIEKIVQSFYFGMPETPLLPSLRMPVYNKDLFDLESTIIKGIADQYQYSAVIVGRGGFYILKDRVNAIHIFIHAPLAYRIERIMKVHKIIDKREAQKMTEESDHKKEKFIRDVVGIDWFDARNYHLCIDSSVTDFPTCVEMITELVSIKKVVQ
ncbi:MAG: AAA family ATPase [Smithellaceae bacterium]